MIFVIFMIFVMFFDHLGEDLCASGLRNGNPAVANRAAGSEQAQTGSIGLNREWADPHRGKNWI